MNRFNSPILLDGDTRDVLRNTDFWHDQELALFRNELTDEEQMLNSLVLKVRRNPRNLQAHLHRIHFCNRSRRPEQLYAALLDLFIIMDGKGEAICKRMLEACRPQLDTDRFLQLNQAEAGEYDRIGNVYSLFTTGRFNQISLLETVAESKTQQEYLSMANDYIHDQQLEQAMDVLESGIQASAEHHHLQKLLLALYQLSGNRKRFQRFHDTLVAAELPHIDRWRTLALSFAGA